MEKRYNLGENNISAEFQIFFYLTKFIFIYSYLKINKIKILYKIIY